MSEIKDGGPAFPGVTGSGISKREWFAGMALQGLISGRLIGNKGNVVAAYEYADAMIRAGKEKQ